MNKQQKKNALKHLEKYEANRKPYLKPVCLHINKKPCHVQYEYCPDCGKYIPTGVFE